MNNDEVRSVRIYDKATGLFTGQVLTASGPHIEQNTPAGHAAFEGHVDEMHAKRVDVATGELVDWQPPQPSADHDWDTGTKRWKLNAVVAAKQAQTASALAQIRTLEASQNRPHRELALDPTNADARNRLTAIDSQIAALRKLI